MAENGPGGIATRGIGSRFVAGLVVGSGGTLVAMAVAMGVLVRQGISVPVNTALVGQAVNRAVTREAARALPALFRSLEARVPPRLAGQLADQLGQMTLQMPGVTVHLDPEVATGLRAPLDEVIHAGVARYLAGLDVNALSRRLGRTAGAGVEAGLERARNRRLLVRIGPGWTVPVVLRSTPLKVLPIVGVPGL